MDALKKFFPLSFKYTKDVANLIIGIIIYLVVGAVAGILIGVLALIPIIGQLLAAITPILYLVPQIVMAWLEYIYLRDTLDLFKPDQKGNRTFALIVAITDALVTFGLARGVCLMTIMGKKPLALQPEEPVEAVTE